MKNATIKTKKINDTDICIAESLILQQAIDEGCFDDTYLIKHHIDGEPLYDVYRICETETGCR